MAETYKCLGQHAYVLAETNEATPDVGTNFSISNDPTEAPTRSFRHKRKMERAQGEKRKGTRGTIKGAR